MVMASGTSSAAPGSQTPGATTSSHDAEPVRHERDRDRTLQIRRWSSPFRQDL